MPDLRPFRALRFDVAADQLVARLAPPYDVISPAERQELLARDPHNAVRLDLPADVGSARATDYAAAARTLAAWRRDGTLVLDPTPSVTVHQMRWRAADGRERLATGFVARLTLEPFGPGSGVLPHERTLSGPKVDRYQLRAATELDTSPIVLVAGSDEPATSAALAELAEGPPHAAATAADGVEHRLWVVPGDDDRVARLLALVAARPLTIADGHHRYETALTYRDDRAAANGTADDPAWATVMALVYPLDQAPPALPTHRVLRDGPSGEALLVELAAYGRVEPVTDRATLLARMAQPPDIAPGASGTGRLGVWSDGHGAVLWLRPEAVDALLDTELSDASRGLDVNALTAVIERVYGSDPGTLAGEGRLRYVKDADDATAQVRRGEAATCFLLDVMPVSAIARVAQAGEVMPQKSTYFDPKAPTGLLFSPLAW